MDQETGWVQLIDLSVHTALTTTHHQPTSSKYGGEQIIYGPGHVMPEQSRDNRPILTRSGFSTHTTPQSTTNFAMKTTSQHSDVIYQTKAKGMLYTYWHSFIVLVFVYIDITCIVVREAALEKLKRTFRFVSAGSTLKKQRNQQHNLHNRRFALAGVRGQGDSRTSYHRVVNDGPFRRYQPFWWERIDW